MKFGILEWEVEQLSQTVDFLDLTITIDADGSVATKTFVKDMNLHLYIPPRSAHPKGILKSLIFGTLKYPRILLDNWTIESTIEIKV